MRGRYVTHSGDIVFQDDCDDDVSVSGKAVVIGCIDCEDSLEGSADE